MENNESNSVFTKDDGYKNNERIMSWINNGDTKISFAFAIIAIISGLTFTSTTIAVFIQEQLKVLKQVTIKDWQVLYSVFSLIIIGSFSFLLLRSVYYFFKGLTAKIDASVFDQDGLETDSKLFWNTISKKTYNEFSTDLISMTKDEIVNDIHSQTYIMSKICTSKFENYNKGLRSLFYSVTVLVILQLLMSF